MNLENKTLETWLEKLPDDQYPHQKKIDYYSLYKRLKIYLDDNVHKEVTFGANLKDDSFFLNDHGPDHINTVINRASHLVNTSQCNLEAYEVFILLCSIQIHDIGNIFGRYKHEINAIEVIKQAQEIFGRDTIERIRIKKIAESHGGKTSDGKKDKISKLQEEENTLDCVIRPRLIASILRFADELADDKNRASKTLLMNGKIPKYSEIYHAYAMCLDSVRINQDEKTICLGFHIPEKFIDKKFFKKDDNVGETEQFLLDEIYERVLKMHYERVYCMRFCKGQIDLENISVEINFYNMIELSEIYPKISFNISEKGYPVSDNNIFDMCEELKDTQGNEIDARYVINKINQ